MSNGLTVETVRAARKLTAIVEEFRKLNPEMQAQQMAIFIAVAGKPNCTITEIAAMIGHPASSVSRNVAALSKYHRKGMLGLDVVVATEDAMDRRHKRVNLTPKGQRVWQSLEALA